MNEVVAHLPAAQFGSCRTRLGIGHLGGQQQTSLLNLQAVAAGRRQAQLSVERDLHLEAVQTAQPLPRKLTVPARLW